jgi:decaprenylphospho-beta-D-ribofuranose 2-oxidase
MLRQAPSRGAIARGLGRSYGDAAQNGGGHVLLSERLDAVIDLDAEHGRITVEAGASLDSCIRIVIPKGWFVPVSPGTRQVTVGGAIAADIHGKNHHGDGSWGNYVESLVLQTPGGTIDAGPETAPDVFWATLGGMGLTGFVTRATIQLLRVHTSSISMDTERAGDLDDLLDRMSARDHFYRYSVAWIDCFSRGSAFGRAVLTRGNHAEVSDLPTRHRADPLAYAPRRPFPAPGRLPGASVLSAALPAFNEVWFRKAPKHEEGRIVSIPGYFHPLDGVSDWNRMYGRRGFLQYQFVVPYGREDVVRLAIESLRDAGTPAFLAVFKRFGEGNPGYISFPIPGWTLALDLPAANPALAPALDRLDEAVAEAGGRVYLAKDSRMKPEMMSAGLLMLVAAGTLVLSHLRSPVLTAA